MFSTLRFKDFAAGLPFALFPVAALVNGLSASGTWYAGIQAWRGYYIDFLSGLPANPWREILPVVGGLILAYVAILWFAVRAADLMGSRGFSYRLRVALGLILCLFASLILFAANMYAALAYLNFGDIRFGGIHPPNSYQVMELVSLAALIVNVYQVNRVNRRSRSIM